MNTPHPLLVDLATILGAAAVLVLLVGRLRQPAVLGYILAGAIFGGSGLKLFPEPARIEQVAEVGVLLLMFAIGLESSLERLRPVRKLALGGGVLQIALTVGVAFVALRLVGWSRDRAVFLGCILAMSSTTIVLRTLHARGETDTPAGRVALGILIVQDLAIVPLTIILPTIVTKQGAVVAPALAAILKAGAALVVALTLARGVVPLVFKQIAKARSHELFSIAVLGLGVGMAVLAEAAGLSLALGAFLAGLALGGTEYEHEARSIVAPFRDAFSGIFFVSIGLLLDLRFVFEHLREVAFLVTLVLVGNTIVTILALLALDAPLRVAVLTGVALAQIGEFSFLLARMGHGAGIFRDADYQMTVAVSVVTMLVTPFFMRLGGPLATGLGKLPWLARRTAAGTLEIDTQTESLDRHAIICGFGPMSRSVARSLDRNAVPYVALELNPTTVENAKKEGAPIHYADATQPEVLELAGVARAKAIIATVPDPASVRAIVKEARARNPKALVIARTKYASAVRDLRQLGADEVIVEELEAGLELLARTLRRFDVPRSRIEQELVAARQAAGSVGRDIEVGPKGLGEISRVLRRVHVEILDVREGSLLVGREIEEGVRAPTGAVVLAVLRGSETITSPSGETILEANDRIVTFGPPSAVAIAEALARAPVTPTPTLGTDSEAAPDAESG